MEELKIELYQDRYEQLLDIETRVNIIKAFYETCDYVPDADICTILNIKRKPKEKEGDNNAQSV